MLNLFFSTEYVPKMSLKAFCPSIFGRITYEVVSLLIDNPLIAYFFDFVKPDLFNFIIFCYVCRNDIIFVQRKPLVEYVRRLRFFCDKNADVFVPFLWFFFMKNWPFELTWIFLQASCFHSPSPASRPPLSWAVTFLGCHVSVCHVPTPSLFGATTFVGIIIIFFWSK